MTRDHSRLGSRKAWSLLELLVVLVILSILLSMASPSFVRAQEQARVNAAAANLRAIWAAQRLYWLEHQQYAADLNQLASLLDPTITALGSSFSYALPSAGANTFRATATRVGSARWSGQLAIDEDGVITGAIQAPGQLPIIPGFL